MREQAVLVGNGVTGRTVVSTTAAIKRLCYVFYWRRPIDPQPWPAVYESQALAEAAPFRVSPVVTVEVPL